MYREWNAVSNALTNKEHERLNHTNAHGNGHRMHGDLYARAHMANVFPSSSVDDESPHHRLCFTNFENALVHKIDSFLPRFRNSERPWAKPDDTILPMICRKLFNAFWNDGKGRVCKHNTPNA